MPVHPSPSPATSPALHLAVALDGAGWHPAAWREPGADPGLLFTAGYWAALVAEAEAGLLDFVTFEDSLSLQSTDPAGPDGRTDLVRGRLDAVLVAARVAPLSRHIGLVPSVVATHTEPFHVSKALATLDYVSRGRAGLRIQISERPDEVRHFGRRTAPWTRPSCTGRPPITSRWSGGCGTAGRTTRRSATRPPDGSSTGPSCTTSTSRAPGSA